MKIITKFTLLYIILLFVTLIISGFVTYQSVKEEVQNETDYSLREEIRILIDGIKNGKPIDALENIKVSIEQLPQGAVEDNRGTFSDTLMMHQTLKSMEVFRVHESSHKINDHVYSITVTDVFIEENDMLEGVVNAMVKIFLVVSLLFIVFGLLFSRIILTPFQKSMEIIDQFDIADQPVEEFPKTTTKEFKQLNEFLKKMMGKATSEYKVLKEFSENASHEMQTPLAIAKGKLEILQESTGLQEADYELIMASQKELSKLSNLTHGLGLLTKLDNDEFRTNEYIDFTRKVNEALGIFKELASFKGVDIMGKCEPDVRLQIEPSLADVLINNLLKNAIHHNIPKGKVVVHLNEKEFIVKNEGKEPSQNPKSFFERFSKGNTTSDSLGLGLSIVKKICDLNEYQVDYTYADGWHELKIQFS